MVSFHVLFIWFLTSPRGLPPFPSGVGVWGWVHISKDRYTHSSFEMTRTYSFSSDWPRFLKRTVSYTFLAEILDFSCFYMAISISKPKSSILAWKNRQMYYLHNFTFFYYNCFFVTYFGPCSSSLVKLSEYCQYRIFLLFLSNVDEAGMWSIGDEGGDTDEMETCEKLRSKSIFLTGLLGL